MRRSLTLLGLATLLAGCPADEEPLCGPERDKQFVLDVAREWYLYPELLPAAVDLAAYAGPAELLDALTEGARAQGKDRGWSFVTTATAQQEFFAAGTSVGFGIGLLVRGDRLLVSHVYPASAAAGAGLQRGDEILRIGDAAGTLAPVAPLIAAGGVGAAFGPAAAGVVRALEILPRGAAAPVVHTLAKATFSLEPVPPWRLLERSGSPPAAYVGLRSFIGPADALLRQAFSEMQAAGVTDVIVDVRYNGGGLVSTAELLANLLGGGVPPGSTMYTLENNPRHPPGAIPFAPAAGAPAFGRIAFITTDASASASELVPNVLEPGRAVALVGGRTSGKPVGQRGFRLRGCETVVALVSFRLVNAEGDGDYFDGLPAPGFGADAQGARTDDCAFAAADDLSREPGDREEASTAAALAWVSGGSCPAAPLSTRALAGARDEYPEAPAPTIAQRHVRGLF